MIKQKVTEYGSNFLVVTKLTFTKEEAEAFNLDKYLKRKVNALINRYKRENMEKCNLSTLLFSVRDIKDPSTIYPTGVIFYVHYNIAYIHRKYIYLNKQKAFAEEIKAKIKASIDAQFYTK